MKLSQISIATLLSLAAVGAFAQAKAPEPDYTLSYNIGANTDYRYRGISQSRLSPAVQGGVDFAHKSGFYLGAWGSTIKWIKDAGGKADVEIDVYGGYKGSINSSVTYDVGVLTYLYPSHKLAVSPNTTELYGALTVGPVTAKYSHSTTRLFGFSGSKGSGYVDVTANFDMGNGWSVAPHIGYQKVGSAPNVDNRAFSYVDYSVAVNKDLGNGLVVSGSVIGADVDRINGVPAYVSPKGKNLGRTGLVVGLKYSF